VGDADGDETSASATTFSVGAAWAVRHCCGLRPVAGSSSSVVCRWISRRARGQEGVSVFVTRGALGVSLLPLRYVAGDPLLCAATDLACRGASNLLDWIAGLWEWDGLALPCRYVALGVFFRTAGHCRVFELWPPCYTLLTGPYECMIGRSVKTEAQRWIQSQCENSWIQ
jgi:hypothetical protein